MKKVIIILVPLLVCIGCVFGDIKLCEWLFSLVPTSEWATLIKVGLGVALGFLTIGIIFLVTLLSGVLASIVTGVADITDYL